MEFVFADVYLKSQRSFEDKLAPDRGGKDAFVNFSISRPFNARVFLDFCVSSLQTLTFVGGGTVARGSEGDPAAKRTRISRAALEMATTNAVRSSDPQCSSFVGIIVEPLASASGLDTN
jgi:hypothetical protein